MAEYPITVEEFRAWLTSKRSNKHVGRRNMGGYCPLANALRERIGGHVCVDMLETVTGDLDEPSYLGPTARWAQMFIEEIDDGPEGEGVRASEALGILDRVAR